MLVQYDSSTSTPISPKWHPSPSGVTSTPRSTSLEEAAPLEGLRRFRPGNRFLAGHGYDRPLVLLDVCTQHAGLEGGQRGDDGRRNGFHFASQTEGVRHSTTRI